MNAADQSSSIPQRSLSWLEEFLNSELAPYPGRGVTVARMVLSATITMLLVMTFRIPGGALGALYAFLVSRDNLRSTFRSGVAIAISYSLGVLFVLSGAAVFADQQSARIAWFAGSMFVVFFVVRTLRYSDVATGFAVLVVNALPIWQMQATAEQRVELTLWQTLAAAIGTVVTIAVEVVFHSIYPRDELLNGLDERLETACAVFECYGAKIPIPEALEEKISRYSIVGTSALRRIVSKSRHRPTERDELGATVALVGRLVDLASASVRLQIATPTSDGVRFARIAVYLRAVLHQARDFSTYASGQLPSDFEIDPSPAGFPYLLEIERTVSLFSAVLGRQESATTTIRSWKSINAGIDPAVDQKSVFDSPFSLLVEDAFENPSHLMWALRGCLAATLCYITYELLDWRGLATSVTTCVITALSTAGSSRQKQILRLGGAIVGGLMLGIGSQIYILPYLDSIASFTILFAFVTCIGAWVATSSARLSYFGVQLALAFYLINLQEFAIQTSLTVARDRVLGILLGLFMMWLVFDRLGATRATTEMIRAFSANLGAMAELLEQAGTSDVGLATKRIRLLREEIRTNFDVVNAQADAVPFEFGLDRERGMAARDLLRGWQPKLRSIYLLELAYLQHRLFEADDPIPRHDWQFLTAASERYGLIFKDLESHLQGLNESQPPINRFEIDAYNAPVNSANDHVSVSARIRVAGLSELLKQIEAQLIPLSHEILQTSGWHEV